MPKKKGNSAAAEEKVLGGGGMLAKQRCFSGRQVRRECVCSGRHGEGAIAGCVAYARCRQKKEFTSVKKAILNVQVAQRKVTPRHKARQQVAAARQRCPLSGPRPATPETSRSQ